MRVVHLTSFHPPDDVRIFLKECRSLARAGFEVHLVAPRVAEETRDGVTMHGFEPPGGFRPTRIVRRLWRVWRAARNVHAGLCHFHEPELVPVALLLKLDGMPVVYDVHEDHLSTLDYGYKPGKRIGYRLLEALARRACDGFVAATPTIARQFPPQRTAEVANYPLHEELDVVSQPAERVPDAISVSGLTRARGVLELVSAAEKLRDPRTRVVLIGGFESPELETEARAHPGWSRVEFLGRLPHADVWKRLRTTRVGLVILHPETNYVHSLPTKLFEYMGAGLPVVVSDFPFFRELLDPIGCATYVDPRDPGQIAAAIDELLADEERAEEMGRRGAEVVRERLNWQREAPKLLELYSRLGLTAAA